MPGDDSTVRALQERFEIQDLVEVEFASSSQVPSICVSQISEHPGFEEDHCPCKSSQVAAFVVLPFVRAFPLSRASIMSKDALVSKWPGQVVKHRLGVDARQTLASGSRLQLRPGHMQFRSRVQGQSMDP
jgi:hypothetical protein